MLEQVVCTAALVMGFAWAGQVPIAQAPPDRAARLRAALPEIDALFAAFAERNRVPGIAYGVLIDGALVHTGHVGTRQLPGRTPIDDDTVFRIASMTKSFTALCILKLRDEGKLSLDDPADKYVPELAGLKYPTSDSPTLTIRHLMSHATGFPEDNPWGDQQLAVTEAEFTEMLRRGIPFSNAPGLAYEYSNYGFAILGRVVTRVSGVTYAEYVTANILGPLGMAATTLEPASVPANRIARGYRWEDNQWKEEPPLPDGAFGAMSGMLTSTRDLGRYVGFLMSAWPARDGPDAGPVKRASLREMQQTHRPRPSTVTGGTGTAPVQLNALGYGYGLGIRQTCEYQAIVSHSGGLPGFGSQMRWLTDEGVGLIAMGNLTYTGWGAVFDQATAVLARTGALTRRQPAPSAALLSAKRDVTALMTKWDDALADRIASNNLFLDVDKAHRRGEERGHLFLVADGMGGRKAGEQASALAVAAIEHFTLNSRDWFFDSNQAEAQRVLAQFRTALREADARILEESAEHRELSGMGTTLTMAYHLNAQLCVVHVGGSRAYAYRDGELRQVTHDHTLVAEMLRTGELKPEDAANHRFRHVITNVVGGNEAGIDVEAHALEVQAGDRLLLCSDGLTDMVSHDEIVATLRAEPDPKIACTTLLARANEAGGRDNITLLIVRFDEAQPA